MNKEELFALAKKAVFGEPPKNKKELVGYRVAVSYYGPLIEDAESVLLGIAVPTGGFSTYLENAFTFSSYDAFREFPDETRNIINKCNDNFRERYEPLIHRPEVRAA